MGVFVLYNSWHCISRAESGPRYLWPKWLLYWSNNSNFQIFKCWIPWSVLHCSQLCSWWGKMNKLCLQQHVWPELNFSPSRAWNIFSSAPTHLLLVCCKSNDDDMPEGQMYSWDPLLTLKPEVLSTISGLSALPPSALCVIMHTDEQNEQSIMLPMPRFFLLHLAIFFTNFAF